MPNPHVFWTPERIAEVRKACSEHNSGVAAALLSRQWGRRITDSAIRAALRADTISALLPPPPPPPPPPSPPDPELLAFQRYKPILPSRAQGSRTANTRGDIIREVIIPDTHIPLHDRLAWACALGIVKEWQPHRVTLIGDFLDLTSLSRHPKARPDLTRLSSEIYAGNVALDELQSAAPNAEWIYIEGNHERRSIRYANEYGSLDGLLTIPEQLFLHNRADGYVRRGVQLRGMKWVPYEDQPYLTPWAAYYHGHNSTATHHAHYHASTYCPSRTSGRPLFYGHMHTFQSFRSPSGGEAHCCGFLGDAKAPELAYSEGRPTAWCHGIMLLECDRVTNSVTLIPTRIVRGRAIVRGKVVLASAVEGSGSQGGSDHTPTKEKRLDGRPTK